MEPDGLHERDRRTEEPDDDVTFVGQIAISHHTTLPAEVGSTPHEVASCSTRARPRPVTASDS